MLIYMQESRTVVQVESICHSLSPHWEKGNSFTTSLNMGRSTSKKHILIFQKL